MKKAELMRKLVGHSNVAQAYDQLHREMLRDVINRQTNVDDRHIKCSLDVKLNGDEQDLLYEILSKEGFSTVEFGSSPNHHVSSYVTTVIVGFETFTKVV